MAKHPMRLCKRGHPITGKNALKKQAHGRTYLTCRLCTNRYMRRYMAKKAAR